jgi:hypothetical protein
LDARRPGFQLQQCARARRNSAKPGPDDGKIEQPKERGMRKQEIRISLLAFNFSAICVADAQRLLYLEAALKWQIKIY